MERGTDAWWDHLVDVLATIGAVSERRPRGLTVVLDRDGGGPQVVEIDMTRREWDDLIAIGGWQPESAAAHVRQLVLDQPRECRYLGYADYVLTPTTTDWERD